MKAIKVRPLAFSCCLFLLSLFVMFFLPIFFKALLASIFLSLWGIIFIYRKKSTFVLYFLLPPLIISSLISLSYFGVRYNNVMSYGGNEVNAEYVVTDKKVSTAGSVSYTILVQKANGKKASFVSILYTDGANPKELFSKHSAVLEFSPFEDTDDVISPKFSYLSKGIYLSANEKDSSTVINGTVRLFPEYYFKTANIFLANQLNKYMKNDSFDLCQALVLGNRDGLSDVHVGNFRRLGLSHVLAVSGMHLALIVGTLDKGIEYLNIGKKRKHLIMIAITFAYAGLTGFSSSVCRAALLLMLYYAIFLFEKSHDGITALCFSAALLCFVSPGTVFDIGLWLSFLSTYGILAVASPVTAQLGEKSSNTPSLLKKSLYKLLSLLLFGTVPVMFSLPVVWLAYGETAVLSPITNILFTPFLYVIMYLVPVTLLLSFIPLLSGLIAHIPSFTADLMLDTAALLAKNAPTVSLVYWFTPYIIAVVVAVFLIIALSSTKKRYPYFITFSCGILAFTICASLYNLSTKNDVNLVYVNTFKGDSFVAVSQNKGLICDVSGTSELNLTRCEYQLNKNHITDVDTFVVTDYRGNGITALDSFLATTHIENIYLPAAQTCDEKILESLYYEWASSKKLNCISYNFDDDGIDFYGMNIVIKKLNDAPVNSPASFCITFASEKHSLAYIGMGCYGTPSGKAYITKMFNKNIPFLFGSYGKDIPIPVTSLKAKKNTKLYFSSEDIKTHYNNTLPINSDVTVINGSATFQFN